MANLTQLQVNALLLEKDGPGQSDGPVKAPKPAKVYDFRRPDKFSKDQLSTLAQVHDDFGQKAANELSARVGFQPQPMRITLESTDQMLWKQYVEDLQLKEQLPAYLAVYQAPEFGPDARFLIEIDLPLVKGLVDRLLGGAGLLGPREAPTPIEAPLIIRNIMDPLGAALKEAWGRVAEISPFMDPDKTNPAYQPNGLRVAAQTDVVVVMKLKVAYEVGRLEGGSPRTVQSHISVCIPHSTLEPVLDKLSAATLWETKSKEPDLSIRQDLTSSLQAVEIPLTAILGGVELPVDALAGLKPGDIIRFAERIDHPVRLTIMDRAVAWATPGRVGDRVAVRLLTPLQQLMEA